MTAYEWSLVAIIVAMIVSAVLADKRARIEAERQSREDFAKMMSEAWKEAKDERAKKLGQEGGETMKENDRL